jgi:hypothetical protein
MKYLAALFLLFSPVLAQAEAISSYGMPPSTAESVTTAQKADRPVQMAQATTQTSTQVKSPTEPTSVTTTVKGGSLAADFIEWMKVVFGGTIGTAMVAALVYGLRLLGVNIVASQRAQLQEIVVNGLNNSAGNLQTMLRDNKSLDITMKGQIIAKTVEYVQEHGSSVIKALGLDPKDPKAVEAIKARIETALNDPGTPTPPAITPPTVNGVIVQGTKKA